MKNKKLKISVLLIATLIASLGTYRIWANMGLNSTGSAEASEVFSLVRPVFAQGIDPAPTFLNQEAGISIYINTNTTLNLNTAKSAMVNIENFTSNYVIGSLSWSNLSSNDYPHCFVSENGWIVVYYLKVNLANPSTTGWLGKIIDWSQYQNNKLTSNFLMEGLVNMTNALGKPSTGAEYYHFQYANATNLVIAIKHAYDGANATFNIEVPNAIGTVYEESWSCYSTTAAGTLLIDNSSICSSAGSGSTSARVYSGTEHYYQMMSRDIFHTVTIEATYGPSGWGWHNPNDAYGCLLLLY